MHAFCRYLTDRARVHANPELHILVSRPARVGERGADAYRQDRQIELAIGRCRGDRVAEPRLTGAWMAHLLISSRALLQNLLIDTARRPRLLVAAPEPEPDPPG